MSAISNYIHLERENYLEYGTYKKEDNKSNYSSSIYAKFREEIRKRSKKFRINEDINKLSIKFNKERNQKILYLQELQKSNPAAYIDFIALVLKTADLDKKYNAEQVAKILTINSDTQTLKLDTIMNHIMSSEEKINIPKISSLWSDIDTLLNHMDICDTKIDLLTDITIKKWLHLRVQYIRKQLQKVKHDTLNENQTLKQIFVLEKRSSAISKSPIGESGVSAETFGQGRVRIKAPLNKIINNEIIQIASMANISGVMSNIKGGFEEVLGALATPLYDRVVQEEMEGFVKNIQSLLNASYVPKGSETATMQLSVQEIELSKFLNQKELKKSKYQYVTKDLNGKLTFELDYSTKNKADFSITVDGKEMGVSAKAIDLSKTDIVTKDGKTIPAHVTLQSGTNLLSYLLKAENVQNKIGTHFLNVYSTVGQVANDYLYEAANTSLITYLLYTALSGDILKLQGNAGLLYVYDTGKKMSSGVERVHFFSISALIESLLDQKGLSAGIDIGLSNFDDMIYINPNLNSVALKLSQANRKVNDYNTLGQNISARLTRVLGEARTLTLSIGLLNAFVRNAIVV